LCGAHANRPKVLAALVLFVYIKAEQ
jgi:hypothetical protein